uniref:Uncharacterized protein n=1 Tax=Leptocylindrus danicus TaxID=163516 RepID=A0A7S2P4K7_9STRA|mmetsp:Transcript_22828/g.34269  ORF Transcript_22828/g.34269 Transcript_22828/m.34269 type:complete len:594 (+) Transcript_22828:282-2063(+)|eukprot:CAMPEP_0116030438 /NCGR_PEP_ID=MMETSP0321-20121206/16856_1 /TAXON_ID=163516 /ORGANISM="Leptocylindrus danicus var. danicus, Strain B650" /LENGTH=593 /DNA_ID=CAMNT_0003505247 /DNA_START=268 /DNA_END=2049 /DNA_ORIENTATION=+
MLCAWKSSILIPAICGVVTGTAPSNLIPQQQLPIPVATGNSRQLLNKASNGGVAQHFVSPACWLDAANALILMGDANSVENAMPCRMEGDERSRFALELTRCFLASTGRRIGASKAEMNEESICSDDYDISSSDGLRRYLSACLHGLEEIIFGQIFNDSFHLCERVLMEARYKRELEVFSDIAHMLEGDFIAFEKQSADPLELIKDVNRRNQELLRHQEDMFRHWRENEEEFKTLRSKFGRWQQMVDAEKKRLDALNPLSAMMIQPVKDLLSSIIYSSILPHLRLCAKFIVSLIITTAASMKRARAWLIAVIILQALFQHYVCRSELWSDFSDKGRENIISYSETASLILALVILYIHTSRYHRKRKGAIGVAIDPTEPLSDKNIQTVYQQLILQDIMRKAPNDLPTTTGVLQSRNIQEQIPWTHVLPRDILPDDRMMPLMHSNRSVLQEQIAYLHSIPTSQQRPINQHQGFHQSGIPWVALQPPNQNLLQPHSLPEIAASTQDMIELHPGPHQHQIAPVQSNTTQITPVVSPQGAHGENDADSEMKRSDEYSSRGKKRKKRDDCTTPDRSGSHEVYDVDSAEITPPKVQRRM